MKTKEKQLKKQQQLKTKIKSSAILQLKHINRYNKEVVNIYNI